MDGQEERIKERKAIKGFILSLVTLAIVLALITAVALGLAFVFSDRVLAPADDKGKAQVSSQGSGEPIGNPLSPPSSDSNCEQGSACETVITP